MKIGRVSIGPTYCLSNIDSSHRGERSLLAQESPGPHERTLRTQTHGDTQQGTLPHAPPLPPTSPPRQPGVARGAMRRRIVVLLQEQVVYLSPADKYHRLSRRPSQGQKGLEERALIASLQPSAP